MWKKIKIVLIIFLCIVSISVPIFADDEEIYVENIDFNEILQTSVEASKIPSINSKAAVIFDRKSKTIIYGKSEKEKRKMASTTKIMTCLIVLENASLSDIVEVSKKAAGTGGSRLGLKTGDKITVRDLLYGLMLCSGNDAAVALAEHVGGNVEGFAELMNNKAIELGLENTHFVTPHGLDNEEHYTTAVELAKITDYALNVEEFSKIVKTKNYTISINGYPKNLNNTNELLGNLEGVYGVKTGFTNGANRCLVTSIKRGNLDIICVVLGADTKKFRTEDSIKLIEYTYKNYEQIDLSEIMEKEFVDWKVENGKILKLVKGKEEYANVVIDLSTPIIYPINKEDKDNIIVEIETETLLDAPVYKNQIVGKVILKINEKVISEANIVCEKDIPKKTYLDYFKQLLEKMGTRPKFSYRRI